MKERPILFSGEMVRAILEGRKTQTRRVIKPQPPEGTEKLIGPEMYEPGLEKNEELVAGPPIFGVYDEWGEWGARCPYGIPGDSEWQSGMPPSDGMYHVQTFDKPVYLRRFLPEDYPGEDITPDLLWAWSKSGDPAAIGLEGLSLDTIRWKRCGDYLWVRETWRLAQYVTLGTGIDYPKDPETGAGVMYRSTWKPSQAFPDFAPKWKPSIHMPRWASLILLEVTNVRVERVRDINQQDAKAEGVAPLELKDGGWVPLSGLDYVGAYREIWNSLYIKRGYGWDTNPWVWVVEFKRIGS